jgi:molybdopterin/thiamine biosynthesis adenylyltransferase
MSDLQEEGRERHQGSLNLYKPERVNAKDLQALVAGHPELRIVDEYDSLLEELFRIQNPGMRPNHAQYFEQLTDFRTKHYAGQAPEEAGNWFYYPWRNAVAHTLPQVLHNQVRTNRNRDLVTETEQQKLRETTIGVAGLSVGSNVLAALSLMGQYRRLKIADADELSLSNMNRLHASITDIGVPKTTLAARGIYERDPEAELVVFAEGLHERNLNDFLDGVDIIFDEIDDVSMKARLRLAARERRLPVIMMTDCGDSGILDIERYDLDADQALFHGRLTDAELDDLLGSRPDQDKWLQLVAKIIGLEHVPSRLLMSFPKIGHELAGAPQLGTAAMVSGGIGAYVARMIALGVPLKTGKIPLIVEANIMKDYDGELAARKALLTQLTKRFNTKRP